MSEVKRYNSYAEGLNVHFEADSEGGWVTSDDYDAAQSCAESYGAKVIEQQSELAALREELAKYKLTAAEHRNATLTKAATEFMEYAESGWDHFPDVGVNLRAALKPTESKQ